MKRILELDALRGFALFGILLVNIFVFHAPISYYGEFYGSFESIQLKTVDFTVNFAGGKFLFIFAFLFGYGMILQANSRSSTYRNYLFKRMLVLFIFGLLHILLFWFGDILASYALLGILAIPLLKVSSRNLLILGTLLLFFRPLYYLGAVTLNWPMDLVERPAELPEYLSTFQNGNYYEIFQLRMKEFLGFIPENIVWYISKTLGVFLVGMYAAQKNLFASIRLNKIKYLLISVLLILVSIIWINTKMDFFNKFDLAAEPLWRPLLISINVFFETTLAIGYIFGFSVVFQANNFITNILAKTGRLALTNYIMQSLICVLVFYGYGLGYYGKLIPTDLLIISMVIFGFNLIFSSLYLKYNSIGPLENLWRKSINNSEKNT